MGKAIPTARLRPGAVSPMVLKTSWARRGFRPTDAASNKIFDEADADLRRYLLGLTHLGSCRSEVLRPGGLRKSPPG
jgi:hypothetical protein